MLCLFRDLSAKISFLCTITLDHHTVAVVSQYLAEVEVPVMADHNPIEHLWDELKKRVEARNAAPTSLRASNRDQGGMGQHTAGFSKKKWYL